MAIGSEGFTGICVDRSPGREYHRDEPSSWLLAFAQTGPVRGAGGGTLESLLSVVLRDRTGRAEPSRATARANPNSRNPRPRSFAIITWLLPNSFGKSRYSRPCRNIRAGTLRFWRETVNLNHRIEPASRRRSWIGQSRCGSSRPAGAFDPAVLWRPAAFRPSRSIEPNRGRLRRPRRLSYRAFRRSSPPLRFALQARRWR